MDSPARTKYDSYDSDSGDDESDVIIGIMGSTGSGKSSFINLLAGNGSVEVGHSLESQTSDIKRVRFVHPSGRWVTIVDTPGFDDSRVSNTEILKRIAKFLLDEYDNKRKLNGLLYFQRISDTRFGAQSQINLKMFRGICGADAYKNVAVLTTFWDKVDKEEGEKRELELKSNSKFFQPLVQGGATFMRHIRTLDGAQKVLEHIFTLAPTKVQITKEIREEGKSLEETTAGSVHREEVERLIAKHKKELAGLQAEIIALKSSDSEMRRELSTEKAEMQRDLASWEEEIAKLVQGDNRNNSLPPCGTVFAGIDQDKARDVFRFAYCAMYPPYLESIPSKYRTDISDIFDFTSLLQTTVTTFTKLPDLTRVFDSTEVRSMDDLVQRNRRLHAKVRSDKHIVSAGWSAISHLTLGMYFSKNIGHRDDWYTDAVFGQQQFTGVNPTSIIAASSRWLAEFATVSRVQRREDMADIINSDPKNFFVQDYSYFRSVVGLSSDADISSQGRYGCSSVVLFHLEPQGKLHPLAITLDYRGNMQKSVTIFNRRTSSSTAGNESDDWPWRYAKMCAQVSDWFRHEITVHLVHTHLLEEVLIVAARRTLPSSHIVLKLLQPHWQTTLSLNEAARAILVPKIIIGMTGFTDTQTYAFIKNAYLNFDWRGSYVPNDLPGRGFPLEQLGDARYHNYGYARNIAHMWKIIRKFVGTVLSAVYVEGDAQVASDPSIAAFCNEVCSVDGGQLASFSAIKTLDELIDFVTMCIHIAAPQHTAVNYLQQYYQTFVPNKPSCLLRPLPRTLAELQGFKEVDILAVLPSPHSRDWLLMAQVPYLLSMEVAADNTILHYAATTIKSSSTPTDIRNAAMIFKNDLQEFAHHRFRSTYLVMDPYRTAVSILI
ncbi:Lipoxygenase [Gymnopus androsaceus JB14]|uniref:Manganese lipoxygenase n=1 Tax=Gymnopus androsaceus JB14 TaxID=1447944 RepID=A0A6A4ID57_9AGAR|nr:Lipoxygenase [Gymnopus androsaceus JB14]